MKIDNLFGCHYNKGLYYIKILKKFFVIRNKSVYPLNVFEKNHIKPLKILGQWVYYSHKTYEKTL